MGLLGQDLADASRIDAVVGGDVMLMLATHRAQPNVYGFVESKLGFVQFGRPFVGPLDLSESKPQCY
jgi:hypothetical protein